MMNQSPVNGGGDVSVVGSKLDGNEGVESIRVFALVLPPDLGLGLGVDTAGCAALFGGGFGSPDLALFGGIGGDSCGGGGGGVDCEDWACG